MPIPVHKAPKKFRTFNPGEPALLLKLADLTEKAIELDELAINDESRAALGQTELGRAMLHLSSIVEGWK